MTPSAPLSLCPSRRSCNCRFPLKAALCAGSWPQTWSSTRSAPGRHLLAHALCLRRGGGRTDHGGLPPRALSHHSGVHAADARARRAVHDRELLAAPCPAWRARLPPPRVDARQRRGTVGATRHHLPARRVSVSRVSAGPLVWRCRGGATHARRRPWWPAEQRRRRRRQGWRRSTTRLLQRGGHRVLERRRRIPPAGTGVGAAAGASRRTAVLSGGGGAGPTGSWPERGDSAVATFICHFS